MDRSTSNNSLPQQECEGTPSETAAAIRAGDESTLLQKLMQASFFKRKPSSDSFAASNSSVCSDSKSIDIHENENTEANEGCADFSKNHEFSLPCIKISTESLADQTYQFTRTSLEPSEKSTIKKSYSAGEGTIDKVPDKPSVLSQIWKIFNKSENNIKTETIDKSISSTTCKHKSEVLSSPVIPSFVISQVDAGQLLDEFHNVISKCHADGDARLACEKQADNGMSASPPQKQKGLSSTNLPGNLGNLVKQPTHETISQNNLSPTSKANFKGSYCAIPSVSYSSGNVTGEINASNLAVPCSQFIKTRQGSSPNIVSLGNSSPNFSSLSARRASQDRRSSNVSLNPSRRGSGLNSQRPSIIELLSPETVALASRRSSLNIAAAGGAGSRRGSAAFVSGLLNAPDDGRRNSTASFRRGSLVDIVNAMITNDQPASASNNKSSSKLGVSNSPSRTRRGSFLETLTQPFIGESDTITAGPSTHTPSGLQTILGGMGITLQGSEDKRGRQTESFFSTFNIPLFSNRQSKGNQSVSSTLTLKTRIQAFSITFTIGILCCLFGAIAFMLKRSSRGVVIFGIFYTLGNILTLISTCFLMGPRQQVKKMFEEARFLATLVYLICLTLTLVLGFYLQNGGLVFISVIVQFLAMLWYSLSYIPLARDSVKKCFDNCFS